MYYSCYYCYCSVTQTPGAGNRCRNVSSGTRTDPSSTSPGVSPSTVENLGLGISLFPAWANFPGLRPQLSILSLCLVLPSFHPIFPGCSCQHQHLANSPESSVPVAPGCSPLLPPGFGDSAWKPGQSRVPWGSTLGRGAGRGEMGGGTQRGSSESKEMGWSNSR